MSVLDDNLDKHKKQTLGGRGRGSSREREKGQMGSSPGKRKPSGETHNKGARRHLKVLSHDLKKEVSFLFYFCTISCSKLPCSCSATSI